jgi:hypothetical protein
VVRDRFELEEADVSDLAVRQGRQRGKPSVQIGAVVRRADDFGVDERRGLGGAEQITDRVQRFVHRQPQHALTGDDQPRIGRARARGRDAAGARSRDAAPAAAEAGPPAADTAHSHDHPSTARIVLVGQGRSAATWRRSAAQRERHDEQPPTKGNARRVPHLRDFQQTPNAWK